MITLMDSWNDKEAFIPRRIDSGIVVMKNLWWWYCPWHAKYTSWIWLELPMRLPARLGLFYYLEIASKNRSTPLRYSKREKYATRQISAVWGAPSWTMLADTWMRMNPCDNFYEHENDTKTMNTSKWKMSKAIGTARINKDDKRFIWFIDVSSLKRF